MVNNGLIVIGVVLIFSAAFITFSITPQTRSQLKIADQLCKSSFLGIPIGQLAQAIDPNIASNCSAVDRLLLLVKLEIPLYFIGFILLLIGFATGEEREVTRGVVKRRPKKKYKIKAKKQQTKAKKEIKKFCSNCGARVKGKFCPKCGRKI